MNFYFANQNKTFEFEYKNSLLWCPQLRIDGHHNHAYDMMGQIKKGDIIFHYLKNVGNKTSYKPIITYISYATSNAYESKKPAGHDNENPGIIGWRVDLDMHRVNFPFHNIMDNFKNVDTGNVFYKNGRLFQGIITRLTINQYYFLKKYIDIPTENIFSNVNDLHNEENKNYSVEDFTIIPLRRSNNDKNKRGVKSFSNLGKNNIDYAEQYSNQADNGALGEKIVLKNLPDILPAEYTAETWNVKPISTNLTTIDCDDSLGYDIELQNTNSNQILRIEVKSTTSIVDSPFFMSANEKLVMENNLREHDCDYLICRVYLNRKQKTASIDFIKGQEFQAKDFSPYTYKVSISTNKQDN